MAKPKIFPICNAILEFKKSIEETSSERNKLLSQLLVNFVLWIIHSSKADLFSMDEKGNVLSKQDSLSIDSFIAAHLQTEAEGYIKDMKDKKSGHSLTVALCNFKKILQFLQSKRLGTIDVDILFEKAKTTPKEKKVRAPSQRKRQEACPIHPLVSLYFEESNFSNSRNQALRLRWFLQSLTNLTTQEYIEYWTDENQDKEKKAVSSLQKLSLVTDHSSITYKIIKVNSRDKNALENILVGFEVGHPKIAKHIKSDIRRFYEWLGEKGWAKESVPMNREEGTHPLIARYLAALKKNKAYKHRKSRLKAFLGKLLRIKQSEVSSYLTKERLVREKQALELLDKQGRAHLEELKDTILYKILSVNAEQVESILKALIEEHPGIAKSFQSTLRSFYRWLHHKNLTTMMLDSTISIQAPTRGIEPVVVSTENRPVETEEKPSSVNEKPKVAHDEKSNKPPKAVAATEKPRIAPRKEQVEVAEVTKPQKILPTAHIHATPQHPKKSKKGGEQKSVSKTKRDKLSKPETAPVKPKKASRKEQVEVAEVTKPQKILPTERVQATSQHPKKSEKGAEQKSVPKTARVRSSKPEAAQRLHSSKKKTDDALRLAAEARRKELDAYDKRVKLEEEARKQKRELEAAKRQKELLAKKISSPIKKSPLERGLEYVENNFHPSYFKNKIRPHLVDELESEDLKDFYSLRNYLLYTLMDLGGLNIKDISCLDRNQIVIGSFGLPMGDKLIFDLYFEMLKNKAFKGKLLFANPKGLSIFKQ